MPIYEFECRECGVVSAEREGKSRLYTLDPAPLEAIRDGWLSSFAAMQSESLRALRRKVEGRGARGGR